MHDVSPSQLATLTITRLTLTVSTHLAPGTSGNGPILSFSGDAEDGGDGDDDDDDPAVDLFEHAAQTIAKAEAGEGDEEDEEEGEGAEPEDDFNAAWEVLDLARAIYDKQMAEDGDVDVKLKLADTYIALGDVSLETGEFAAHVTLFRYRCLILGGRCREI